MAYLNGILRSVNQLNNEKTLHVPSNSIEGLLDCIDPFLTTNDSKTRKAVTYKRAKEKRQSINSLL